ncbi:unnamed protein product [Mytilus edulis]|uniref:ATP-dependent DNA helicase n=1 Tax=Mytilus edulis TaxID=6550 RepID=A0A8S3T7M0_MYTED|nr:unnamed protein product [Mytilus edulis]
MQNLLFSGWSEMDVSWFARQALAIDNAKEKVKRQEVPRSELSCVISQNCHELDQSVISQNCHDLDLDESIISLHCQYTVEKDEIILENKIENILENAIENILENKIEHLYEYETEKLDQSVSSTNYQYKRNIDDDNIYQNKWEIQNQTEKLDQNQVKKLDKNRIEKLDKNWIEKLDKKIVQNQTEKLDQNQTEKQDENRIVKKKYKNLIKQLDLNHNCPYIETESETVLMNKVQMEQYQSKIKNKTSFKAQCNNTINTAKVKDCVKVSRPGIRNTSVQGSFHQGDLRFGLNSGKQCVANCCSALAFSKLKDLTYWDQKYLDKVLIYGNDLYSRVSGNNHHLLISDLPPILDISGTLMQLSLKESISAVIDTSETIDFSEFGNSLPLDQALQESLVDYDACFICAYDTSFLALKHGQGLFLFDSHARNEFGLKHSNGKSLLLKLSSLDHLYQYCCNMVPGARQNQWFEVTGVSISIVEEPVMYNNDHKVPENNEQMNNTTYSNIGNHETMNTSDYELPEIVEVENEKGPDLTKVQENINLTLHTYSSESNANDNTNKNESDVEIVSATDLAYEFKPINTIAKKKLCPIPRFKTVKEHIQTLQMKENNVWGTELEILACADLLKTDIYTYYNDSWIKYSSSQLCSKNKINDQAIYLQHLTAINHYEVVTAVTQKSRFQNRMQSSPVGREKYEFERKYEVPTLKINDSDNYSDDELKVLSKAEKERIRYRKDEEFKARKNSTLKRKYWENETYRDNLIQAGIKKYREDKDYRDVLKESGIQKYQENDKYREKLRRASIYKYEVDEQHKKHVKQASVQKYKEDEKHKEHVKQASIQKYADDDSHRSKVKQQTKTRRENLKEENKQITEVIRKFKDAVQKGSYDNSIYDSCTTEKYKHKCTDDCNTHCAFEGTCRTSLWICYTCHRKMIKGKTPAESFSNGLMLEDVPLELKQLNAIEQQLIALNIPFMKIMALPKGGQKGVHGPVVCVPSDLTKVTTILPRSEDESLLLKVKLKRKLNYKGYEKYQFVRPNHLEQALVYLKDTNVWYKDVAINDEWINPIPEVNDDEVVNDETESDSTESVRNNKIQKDASNMSKSSKESNEREEESEQYSYIDDRLRGVQLDTCLQPADIGQEALDLCFDQVFNLAPAENNNPLSVLKEPGIEAKTFPVHFPSGKNTSDEDRDEKLTIGRYFNLRLMSVENRFARDTNYIFFSQYLTELSSVISNVQISLRKQCPFSKEGKKVTREMLCNKETLKELFKKDEAIKYLKPIRGTPPYWQSSQKDIFAMIRQEISAQEAVFRVTGLRLRECSRKVEFIPVGENPCRMSVPLKDLEKQQNCKSSKRKRHNSDSEDEDEDSTWMNNIVDRYKGRPHIDIFIKLCLARFTSEYSVILESQLPQKINKDTTFKLDGSLGYIRKRTRTSPAVIKYPRFSPENSPEKYYQSILQLYLPYRYDEQLKPLLFQTYENFFTCGRVKFQGDNTLSSVKEIVIKNMSDFVKNGHDLEEAEKQFHEKDPKEDAWCELCPEAEVNRRECIDEGKVSSVIEEDLSIPDLNEKSSSSVGTNLLSVSLTKNEIIPRLRSLNVKQRRILYKVRDWCIQKANGKTPEPLHLFITGGAGTGKSHLIKCIQYEATRILAQTTNNPDDLTVLLTAPTGTAAFNIHGLTIHSALGIFKSLSPDHATLSEDKINSLRSKLEHLQILIIDEISMLPPVRTKRVDKLYVDDPSNPSNQLWNGLFEIAELDEIMRQREDGMFAELLNRLRVKQKNESLSSSDKETLQHCFGDSPDEALHIYSTNAEVDTFNKEMIMKQCTESKLIEAQDFQKDKTSGKLTLKKVHCLKSDVCLPISILLAEGARVMLIKNEDTADGLVNGVMGTVISIKDFSPNSLPSTIYVHFDNERVGRNAKVQKLISGKHCVGLKPSSEDIPLSNCVRKQFPLKLAWACTIHKVQGLTVEECVVDLNKCFTYGQAYVALAELHQNLVYTLKA